VLALTSRTVGSLALVVSLLLARAASADDTPVHACVQAAHDGQSLRDAGKLTSARDALVACSAVTCPEVVRSRCERWLTEIEPRIPTIVLGARDAGGHDLQGARATLDGKPAAGGLDGTSIAIDPGPHEIIIEAAGFAPSRTSIVVREGEKLRPIVATLASTPAVAPGSPQGQPSLVPVIVTGALAGLGLAGFVGLGLAGQSQRNQLSDGCRMTLTCDPSDVSSARAKLIAADVSLGVGVGALAAFSVLMIRRALAPKSDAAVPVAAMVTPTPGGGVLSVRLGR
jgi:hypothetical protein